MSFSCCANTPFKAIFGKDTNTSEKKEIESISDTTSVQLTKHVQPSQTEILQYAEHLRFNLHNRANDTFKNPNELQDVLVDLASKLSKGQDVLDDNNSNMSQCYFWHGPVDRRGYPRIQYTLNGELKDHAVMRLLVFLFANEDDLDLIIEENSQIKMLCDHPKCVRVMHIAMLDEEEAA